MADSAATQSPLPTPVQSPLSLFMPLASPEDVAAVIQLLQQNQAVLGGALDTIHTVHFARFMLLNVDGTQNLVLFTEYDGNFVTYVKDFVAKLGPIFDALLAHVADPPPTPVADHADEFVTWVQKHDRTTPQQGLLRFYSAYPRLTVVDILSQSS